MIFKNETTNIVIRLGIVIVVFSLLCFGLYMGFGIFNELNAHKSTPQYIMTLLVTVVAIIFAFVIIGCALYLIVFPIIYGVIMLFFYTFGLCYYFVLREKPLFIESYTDKVKFIFKKFSGIL